MHGVGKASSVVFALSLCLYTLWLPPHPQTILCTAETQSALKECDGVVIGRVEVLLRDFPIDAARCVPLRVLHASKYKERMPIIGHEMRVSYHGKMRLDISSGDEARRLGELTELNMQDKMIHTRHLLDVYQTPHVDSLTTLGGRDCAWISIRCQSLRCGEHRVSVIVGIDESLDVMGYAVNVRVCEIVVVIVWILSGFVSVYLFIFSRLTSSPMTMIANESKRRL